ncbi:MAG: DUF2304 domain-containing protein [Candidatus Rokubacteria bacterium]|nr:DUF2304 domain-containing protein [Candidatus Rokubacteria bacterium]
MNLQAVLAINAIGIGIIVFVLSLLRRQRLHIGYGALWIGASVLGMLVVSAPPVFRLVTRVIPTSLPFQAVVVMALSFIFIVLIYFSVQLSALLRRVTDIAQHIGISELEAKSQAPERNPVEVEKRGE